MSALTVERIIADTLDLNEPATDSHWIRLARRDAIMVKYTKNWVPPLRLIGSGDVVPEYQEEYRRALTVIGVLHVE